MDFKDHFSGHSIEYARHRPVYPTELFDALARIAPARDLAWDCATGNGQAAIGLAAHFRRVIATDASEAQLRNAPIHPRVQYRRELAEGAGFKDGEVDLVTVAQAAHWFDLDRFYAEVRRVLRPGGVLAVWCYSLAEIAPDLDCLLRRFYQDVVGAYWPPERSLIDAEYRTLPFPFEVCGEGLGPFYMERDWTLDAFLDYLRTWSSVRRYEADRGTDPLHIIVADMNRLWGKSCRVRKVRWRVHLRVGGQ